MKVIFLDIDGVLNVMFPKHDLYGREFHPHLVDNLRYIIDETNAKIVITSTWRSDGIEYSRDMWKYRNLPSEIIGITPNLRYKYNTSLCRGEEIKLYIEKCGKDISKYVIIDDDYKDILDFQKPYFVQTSDNIDHEDCVDIGYGLTKKCAEKAIEILND